MRTAVMKIVIITFAVLFLMLRQASGQATSIPASRQIAAEELVKLLQRSGKERPLLIQVGSHVLYAQAHIPGSEYIGPASSEAGLQQLRKRVQSLSRTKFIVLYCGVSLEPLPECEARRRCASGYGVHQRKGALSFRQLWH